ncbi:ketoacyl-synthetase C-terminal extension domain-containing protein, partial [Streptomyces sp. SID3343]|uniref:ketoacyl-synthetase C-terminal extension domain-containing protein n=1 Tax=Streptomyces sp. SID3343 TaxID=2690260 RepID=UPI0031F9405B
MDWSAGAVRLLTESRTWPQTDRPRRAGVSSFGVSGTNAHVILEQPQDEPDSASERTTESASPDTIVPWIVSAKRPLALRGQAERLTAFVAGEVDAVDVGAALATARAALAERAVVVGESGAELHDGLAALAHGESAAGVVAGSAAGTPGKTVFVFPGQGSQWVGMAAELFVQSPVFAARFEASARALAP